MKLSGFLAHSLDGYIAGANGELDFLDSFQDSGEDAGYGEFFLSVDAILMGKKTFETVLQFPEWPYTPKPVYVFSRNPVSIPPLLVERAFPISGSTRTVVSELSGYGYNHIYVDGGRTISSFLADGLLDELTISVIPIILGNGIPLFSGIPKKIPLTLSRTRHFPSGIVQNLYKIIK